MLSPESFLPAVPENEIKGFRVLRQFFNNKKFDVYAVNAAGALVVCFKSNLDLEEATTLVSILNAPYELPEPQATTLNEVQVGNQQRFYNVAA